MYEAFDELVTNKRVLVTGGTGSLGWALAPCLVGAKAKVKIFTRDEKKQLDMRSEFPDFEYILGDIRDPVAVRHAVRDVQIVIHGASLKYVDVSEQQPGVYISTNVVGTQNLLAAVFDEKTVEICIGISSDKACNPINTYGMTKALLEKLFLEAHSQGGNKICTVFTIARYGNVLATRGSVVLRWAQLRKLKLPLQVTDPGMTRFLFTLDEAIELIGKAGRTSSGLIVSQAMRACTLGQLANIMSVNGVEVVGRRPGEKLHESLLSEMEMAKTWRVGDYFYYNPLNLKSPVMTSPGNLANEYMYYGGSAYTSDIAPMLSDAELTKLVEDYL